MMGMENGVATIEQSVRVTMTLAHAKLLAFLIMNQVGQYEQQFGKVELPPQDSMAEPESVIETHEG
jgi:hypothetical protein